MHARLTRFPRQHPKKTKTAEKPNVLDTVFLISRMEHTNGRHHRSAHTRISECILSHSLTFTCHLWRTRLASLASRFCQRNVFFPFFFFETTIGDANVWARKKLKTSSCGSWKCGVMCRYVGYSCGVDSAEKLIVKDRGYCAWIAAAKRACANATLCRNSVYENAYKWNNRQYNK